MNILHAIWSLELGGAEAMLVDLVSQQASTDVVSVLVGNSVANPELLAQVDGRVRVIHIGRPPASRNPWYVAKIAAHVLQVQPDIIHCHNGSLIGVLRGSAAKKILTVHDTVTRLDASARRFDGIVSISASVAQGLTCEGARVESTVIHNGVRIADIPCRPARAPQGPFRLVQVSRMVAQTKGQDVLLRALRILFNEGVGREVEVDFIGGGQDESALRGLAGQLGLNGSCRFLGPMPRPEVYRRLSSYDGMVQPSRSEGFGLTVVEGVAAGLPVVASALEGPLEILGPLPYRHLFAAGDAEGLAAALRLLVRESSDPATAVKLEENRRLVQERFDLQVTVDRYRAEYMRLLHAA